MIQRKGRVVGGHYLAGAVTRGGLKFVSGFALCLPGFRAGFPGSHPVPVPLSGECHRVLPSAPVGTGGDPARASGTRTCPQRRIKLMIISIDF